MKTELIKEEDLEKVSPVFEGAFGRKLVRFFMHAVAIDKVNWVYEHSINYSGAEFSERLLKDVGVDYLIGNAERLQQLPEGAFITISNHPYGGLDGIMLIDLMVGIRQDYKLMVNQFLSLIKTMDANFISVTSKTADSNGFSTTSLKGIRETLTRLKEGHPVGFFPSGAVSDFNFRNFRIRDREWQESLIRLIQTAKVPVLPIRFFDQNSPFFYLLGLIHWRIRALRLPSEVFNKGGQHPHIGIGKLISVEAQDQFEDPTAFGKFLRNAVYEMPKPTDYLSKEALTALRKDLSNQK